MKMYAVHKYTGWEYSSVVGLFFDRPSAKRFIKGKNYHTIERVDVKI